MAESSSGGYWRRFRPCRVWASVTKWIPFEQQGNEAVFSEDHVGTRRTDALSVLSNTVGEEYFRVTEIPVLHGRVFDRRDDDTAPRVSVINE